MPLHYFKIAWRYLLKQRMLTIINISGLTVGITVSLLIFLYVRYDLNYDRFNNKADRIYRIGLHGKMGDTEFTQTYTTAMLASELINSCPEVKAAVRLTGRALFVKYDDGKGLTTIHEEKKILVADSSLFDIFSLNVLAGDPRAALKEPGTLTLSESAVNRYFKDVKNSSDVLNKQLQIYLGGNFMPFNIRGVIKDMPEQSHFHFDLIASLENVPDSHYDNWWNNNFQTYILLNENNDIKSVIEKLPGIYRKNKGGEKFDAWLAEGNEWQSFVQPLLDIHLKSNITGEWEPNSNIQYDWILSVVSVFIILIACINFINLSTSKAVIRAKEIGIKKTLGSRRHQLVLQLLVESVIVCFLAVNFALVCTRIILPAFNQFTGKHLGLMVFGTYYDLIIISGFIIFLGLLSGLYPAFYITSFQPANALKGKYQSSRENLFFRNILVVFQFAISIVIITCTFVVNRQLDFIRNQSLGFNKENILVLKSTAEVNNKLKSFRDELLKYPDVKSVSASSSVPGMGQNNMQFRPEGYEDNVLLDVIFADEEYANTFGLKMRMGRYFDNRHPSDSISMVINQAAMENLGWKDPLGKTIRVYAGSGIPTSVIGVLNDYHYISKHEKIRPFVIIPSFSKKSFGTSYISIKISGANVPDTRKKIEKTWKNYTEMPFEFFFMDESYDQLYRNEAYTQSIFRFFSVISIFIALLGLFGLVVYNINNRTKEIGIRKAFGASTRQIVMLLSGNFSRLIIIGFIIAVPLSWWFMHMWLMNFEYKTEISVWIYVVSFFLVVMTAWMTTGYQSVKAALRNPVEALRYE